MRNFASLFMLVMLVLTGCSKIDDGGQGNPGGESGNSSIELGSGVEQEIILDSDGGSKIIRFTAPQNWHVELAGESDWLVLSPVEGDAGTGRVKVKAEANTSGGTRRAEFSVCSGTHSVQFYVIQDHYEMVFEVPETEMHISASGGILPVPINTNQDFDVTCNQDWLMPSPSQGKRPEYVVVVVEPNLSNKSRTSEVVISSDMGEATVTVTQDAVDGTLAQWTEKSFVSRSLAMRFTATWCGYCPMMGKAFDIAKDRMGGSLELVSLHGSESDLEFSGTNQLGRRFSIGRYPTGVVDARASIQNYSSSDYTASLVEQVAQETRKSYPTVSGIAVDSYLSGTELTVFVPIYFHKSGSYRVSVLLLEDGIVGYQNGGGSNYTHNDVARYAFTSMSGESVRIESDNTAWNKVYTARVNSVWNPENLKVLVYVERSYGDQARAEGVEKAQYGDYGDTYIDNCRAVKVGEAANVELK